MQQTLPHNRPRQSIGVVPTPSVISIGGHSLIRATSHRDCHEIAQNDDLNRTNFPMTSGNILAKKLVSTASFWQGARKTSFVLPITMLFGANKNFLC
jgi:hypothetical protein